MTASARQAWLLGTVQGLTEFLPVSSTAHLILLPRLLGWQTPGLVFDTSLHMGTLLAMGVYFRADFQSLAQGIGRWLFTGQPTPESQLATTLFCANIPAGVAGLWGERWIVQQRQPQAIAAGMLVGALLMLGAEQLARGKGSRGVLPSDFLGLGLAQALALMPGISRSGITISTGLAMGLSRGEAARASFLLGLPVITASGVYKLKELAYLPRDRKTVIYFLSGVAAAAVSGYAALHFFHRWVPRHSLGAFALYRLLIGGALLGLDRQVSPSESGQA